MPAVQMQARSSTDGQLKTWVTVAPDWAAAGFPGPGSAQDVAVSMRSADSGSSGVSDHGLLTGLGDQTDHTWATTIDGTRPFTADQSMGSHKLTSLASPSDASDATNKAYVDAVAAGLQPKPSVKAVATANQATMSGTGQTIDGVALSALGDRVLLTAQSTASQNGPWVIASGAWTRPTDFSAGSDAAATHFFVQQGTSFADTGWVCSTNTGSAVVDTNNLTFVQFSAAGVPVAGNGLSKTGQTFAVVAEDATITVGGSGIKVASQLPARGGENVIVDLYPSTQAQGTVNTGSSVTHDVSLTSGKRYIVTADVQVDDGSGNTQYVKALSVRCQNRGGTCEILATTVIAEVYFAGAVYTFLASISTTNLRFALANTSGTNRPYNLIIGVVSLDKP